MAHDTHDSGTDEYVGLTNEELCGVLAAALDRENELLRTYVITAERVHDNDALKERLRNFSEGNAKRAVQLMDELKALEEQEDE